MEAFRDILETAESLQAVRKEQEKFREKSAKLRSSIKKKKENVIRELARKFCEEMRDQGNFEDYICNAYANPFTEYVNRKGVSLSGRHRDARKKFTAAWRELNESLAIVARDDPENFIRQVVRHSGLKNLTNGE